MIKNFLPLSISSFKKVVITLINENNKQKSENKDLKKQNEILEFEIKSAQNSNDHVENFAREKLNLTLPEEEFILFKEETKKEKDERK